MTSAAFVPVRTVSAGHSKNVPRALFTLVSTLEKIPAQLACVRWIGSVEAEERRTQSVLWALCGAVRRNCQEIFNLTRGFSPFSLSLFCQCFCSTLPGRKNAITVKILMASTSTNLGLYAWSPTGRLSASLRLCLIGKWWCSVLQQCCPRGGWQIKLDLRASVSTC